jgi:hypothetical protein
MCCPIGRRGNVEVDSAFRQLWSVESVHTKTIGSEMGEVLGFDCHLVSRLPLSTERGLPVVSLPQRLHLHLAPPASQVHQGLTYARHEEQRAGPASSAATTGTGSSRTSRSAKGCSMTARGIEHVSASLDDAGIAQVVGRANLGLALPGT